MFETRVEKTIACAHRLFNYAGPCESLHGHNYRIEVAYGGRELDSFGMLVDFTDIKKVFHAVLDTLDHSYLNDLPAFRDVSPSAENIADHVFLELARAPFPRARLLRVSVWETPTQVAVFSGPAPARPRKAKRRARPAARDTGRDRLLAGLAD